MSAYGTKKSKNMGVEDGQHIEGDLVVAIEKLQELQDELEKVDEEASDQVLEVEQKYNEIRRPVYVKRNEIIKSIPDFWLIVFLSHPVLGDLLNEQDQKIFKYLDFLDVEDFKDIKTGYSISFNFKRNPYFDDAKLTKSFTFLNEGMTRVTSTAIRWKEGMDIVSGAHHEKKGNKRPPFEVSFFSWFTEMQIRDIAEAFHDEVADLIKEDLWPNPLRYFSNEPDEVEFEGDEDEEGKGDTDEEDDEEDGNADDEEDDEE
ncbi:chromatin/chromatin-binding, or -regulatory protein [Lithospermum erythrorhizon]|uniref:Chromatin/chromatin-binding, or -regulatory protein n=1 Tax=Lithospermum erythrorhizon TaxID=34254 RepID=A0AAV3R539_LITER